MRTKILTVIANDGSEAIVTEQFAEVVKPAADCSAADFQLALPPGKTMWIPVPEPDVAASRRAHLKTVGQLNQVRADLQVGKYAEADSSLKQYIQAYVDEFTTSIAAGRG